MVKLKTLSRLGLAAAAGYEVGEILERKNQVIVNEHNKAREVNGMQFTQTETNSYNIYAIIIIILMVIFFIMIILIIFFYKVTNKKSRRRSERRISI